jgi:hypothetical protein
MKIAAYRLPEFEKKIQAFNKKATKWGLPLISYAEQSRYVKTIVQVVGQDEEGRAIENKFELEFIKMEVTGATPKVGGWFVHSRVEPSGEPNVNYVYTQKNCEPVEKLRTTAMICEHCNHKRGRSMVFLLQNEQTGEQKLVGKSCLKDFLPDVGIENLLSYLGSIPAVEEDMDEDYAGGGCFGYAVYDPKLAIAEALVLILRDGFVSKKLINELMEKGDERAYGMMPTSSFMANTGRNRHKFYTADEIAAQFEGEQESRVEKVIKFINEKNAYNNDFIFNLQTAVNQQRCPYKMFPFLAAGVQMWIKSQEDLAKKEAKANEHLGQVGTRSEFKSLTIVRVTPVDGAYGTTYITGFEDEKGNSVVWFASKRIGEVGKVVNIKATVKNHDEYKGRNQTIITRAALI